MKSVSLLDASPFTSPNPVSLICTKTAEGKSNLGTVSWWTYLSIEPARIGFAMMKPSFTGETVRATKKAVLAVPGEPLAKIAMQCGCTTGREKDKVAEFGIPMKAMEGTDILVPEHSVVLMSLTLHEHVDVGDHWFYVCDVDRVLVDGSERALFAWKGYAKLAPAVQG